MPARMRVRARRNRVPTALHAREGAARAKSAGAWLARACDSCKCEACVCMHCISGRMHACPGARRGKRPRPDPGVFEHRRWRAPHKRAQYRAVPPAAQPLPCRPAMPGRCPAAAPPRAPRCGWRSMWAGGGRPESCSPPTRGVYVSARPCPHWGPMTRRHTPRTPTGGSGGLRPPPSPSAWEITPEGGAHGITRLDRTIEPTRSLGGDLGA